jgi:hypothetical protein
MSCEWLVNGFVRSALEGRLNGKISFYRLKFSVLSPVSERTSRWPDSAKERHGGQIRRRNVRVARFGEGTSRWPDSAKERHGDQIRWKNVTVARFGESPQGDKRAILNFTPGDQGWTWPPGVKCSPLRSHPGVNAHYCLEELRGRTEKFTPRGQNFIPGGQLRPWGQSLLLGSKLRMGLWIGERASGWISSNLVIVVNYRSIQPIVGGYLFNYDKNRVTRLGEPSTIERVFSFGRLYTYISIYIPKYKYKSIKRIWGYFFNVRPWLRCNRKPIFPFL